jgi:hypothetical protein
LRSIPRAALISLLGPSLLLLVGYLGWRFYGARYLDEKFYSLREDKVQITTPPPWLKSPIVHEVFEGSGLERMSLLDDQMGSVIARAFDAHPWIRKTHRAGKWAGGCVKVDVEYRIPVAMVHCESAGDETSGGIMHESFLPVDTEAVVLPTKDFSQEDIPQFILIYGRGILATDHRKVGVPFGDTQVEEAVKLCKLLLPIKNDAKIVSVYVYPSREVGKSRWKLEVVTKGGPRMMWGSSPGFEHLGEPSASSKLNRIVEMARRPEQWALPEVDLSQSTNLSRSLPAPNVRK